MSRDERGSGTLITVGIALLLIVITGTSTVLVAWFSLIRDAEQAAELAALAGASAAVSGADPCAEAERVARKNSFEAEHCAVRGTAPDVVVEVGVIVVLAPSLPGAPEEVVRFATAGVL